MTISYALVGCGIHSAEVTIPSLLAVPGIHCVWVCDPDRSAANRASARFGSCPVFSSWEAGVQHQKPEAIIAIATPEIHFQVAEFSLHRDIPIFVEKPPSISLSDVATLGKMAAHKKIPTMVGHNLRHSEVGQNMKKILSEVSFGRVNLIQVRYFAAKPRGDRWQLGSPPKAFFLSHLTHAIDYFLFLTGESSMHVRDVLLSHDDCGVSVSVSLDLDSGGIGSILASNMAPYFDFGADVLSTEEVLIKQTGTRGIEVFSSRFEKRWGRVWVPKTLQAGLDTAGYQSELTSFFDAVHKKDATLSSPSFSEEVRVFSVLAEIEQHLTMMSTGDRPSAAAKIDGQA